MNPCEHNVNFHSLLRLLIYSAVTHLHRWNAYGIFHFTYLIAKYAQYFSRWVCGLTKCLSFVGCGVQELVGEIKQLQERCKAKSFERIQRFDVLKLYLNGAQYSITVMSGKVNVGSTYLSLRVSRWRKDGLG